MKGHIGGEAERDTERGGGIKRTPFLTWSPSDYSPLTFQTVNLKSLCSCLDFSTRPAELMMVLTPKHVYFVYVSSFSVSNHLKVLQRKFIVFGSIKGSVKEDCSEKLLQKEFGYFRRSA